MLSHSEKFHYGGKENTNKTKILSCLLKKFTKRKKIEYAAHRVAFQPQITQNTLLLLEGKIRLVIH